jgi:hypothetical protein
MAIENGPSTIHHRDYSTLRRWGSFLLIAILPPILAVMGFVRPPISSDALFYGYQLKRAGELDGRWWKVGEDPKLGRPYQAELAKHAGLYEGVDLMLIAAWPSRHLDPRQTLYFAAYVAIAINGWVAGGLTLRATRSCSWACLAIVLITWNYPTAIRVLGHLHLFKYGWALLAIDAFWRYLDEPRPGRGAWLGCAVALAFQGSFYLGFLLILALGSWWVGCLISRRVGRAHLGATFAAGLALAVAGFAATFPVWTIARGNFFSDDFFQRIWGQTWYYGSELWQYFVPQSSQSAQLFISQVGKGLDGYGEGWNFPGYTILLAVGTYLFARLRGWHLWERHGRSLDRMVGLMGVFVVLSLSGGPSYFLFQVPPFSCFRCYGRAGLLALAVGCVAAPLIFQGLLAALRPRGLRVAALAGIVALAAVDARHALSLHNRFLVEGAERATANPPAWTDWLARQPADVHLAAFATPPPRYPVLYWWGIDSAGYRLRHGHATLNGCDQRLLEGDLRLLGASYERMNPVGLRFVVSLGYETLAFDEAYLKANPWIRSLAWLDWLEEHGGWSIARANRSMPAFERRSLTQLLAEQPKLPRGRAIEVPPWAAITGQLQVERETVVPEDARVAMVWIDAEGKPCTRERTALFQHVYGPSIPAYRTAAPDKPGDYELVFLDRRRRRLAAIPYRVTTALRTSRTAPDERLMRGITFNIVTAEVEAAGHALPLRIAVENTTPLYLQTLVGTPGNCLSVAAHPGLVYPGNGSVTFVLHADADEDTGFRPQDIGFPMPRDLPPHGTIELEIPTDRLARTGRRVRIMASTNLGSFGRVATAEDADVRLSLVAGPASRLARAEEKGHRAEARRRVAPCPRPTP